MKIYEIEINGKDYRVEVESEPGHIFKVAVNGREYRAELKSVQCNRPDASGESPTVVRQQISEGNEVAGLLTIRAPIPGEVRKVMVKPGDTIKEGDIVLVIEAMKMENNIVSSAPGRVKEVLVKEGELVKLNQALASLEVMGK